MPINESGNFYENIIFKEITTADLEEIKDNPEALKNRGLDGQRTVVQNEIDARKKEAAKQKAAEEEQQQKKAAADAGADDDSAQASTGGDTTVEAKSAPEKGEGGFTAKSNSAEDLPKMDIRIPPTNFTDLEHSIANMEVWPFYIFFRAFMRIAIGALGQGVASPLYVLSGYARALGAVSGLTASGSWAERKRIAFFRMRHDHQIAQKWGIAGLFGYGGYYNERGNPSASCTKAAFQKMGMGVLELVSPYHWFQNKTTWVQDDDPKNPGKKIWVQKEMDWELQADKNDAMAGHPVALMIESKHRKLAATANADSTADRGTKKPISNNWIQRESERLEDQKRIKELTKNYIPRSYDEVAFRSIRTASYSMSSFEQFFSPTLSRVAALGVAAVTTAALPFAFATDIFLGFTPPWFSSNHRGLALCQRLIQDGYGKAYQVGLEGNEINGKMTILGDIGVRLGAIVGLANTAVGLGFAVAFDIASLPFRGMFINGPILLSKLLPSSLFSKDTIEGKHPGPPFLTQMALKSLGSSWDQLLKGKQTLPGELIAAKKAIDAASRIDNTEEFRDVVQEHAQNLVMERVEERIKNPQPESDEEQYLKKVAKIDEQIKALERKIDIEQAQIEKYGTHGTENNQKKIEEYSQQIQNLEFEKVKAKFELVKDADINEVADTLEKEALGKAKTSEGEPIYAVDQLKADMHQTLADTVSATSVEEHTAKVASELEEKRSASSTPAPEAKPKTAEQVEEEKIEQEEAAFGTLTPLINERKSGSNVKGRLEATELGRFPPPGRGSYGEAQNQAKSLAASVQIGDERKEQPIAHPSLRQHT